MAGPNYRHTPKENKPNPFLESVKKLLAAKEQEEESSADEMEDGFIKTKPREYPQSYQKPAEDTQAEWKESAKQGITLSSSACMTALVTIVTSVAFAFLFGLIIGKGMTPVIEKEEPVQLTAKIQEEKKVEVLPKEELQFMTSLKVEPERKTAEQTAKEEEEAKKEAEAKEKALEAQKEIQKQEAAAAAAAEKKYNFDIRVAAFRSEGQADDLRIKLESDGFRTKKNITKDARGNWYFVHVLLIGTEQRLKESQERFKTFGVRDTIIESKTEVK